MRMRCWRASHRGQPSGAWPRTASPARPRIKAAETPQWEAGPRAAARVAGGHAAASARGRSTGARRVAAAACDAAGLDGGGHEPMAGGARAGGGDLDWLTSECEPSERHDFTGVLEEGEDLLARLRLCR